MILKKNTNASGKAFPFTKKRLEAAMHDLNSKSSETEFSDTGTSCLRLVVTKKGGKYYRYRGTLNGKKWTERIGPFLSMTLQEARQKAQEWKGLLDHGIDPRAQLGNKKLAGITFDDFVRQYYLPYAMANKRSVKNDVSKLNRHMRPAFGPRALDSISTGDVDLYLSQLKNKKNTKGESGRPLSRASRNRHLALLSSIFKKAIDHIMATRNPCDRLKQVPENNMRTEFLNEAELEAFVRECLNEENRVMGQYLLFQLLTGARRQEGLNAVWDDINFATKNWTIPHTKSGKSREVPLNDMALQLLQGLEQVEGNAHLFPGRKKGKPVNNPMKAFHRILARAGIKKKLRIHDLRHTFASVLAMGGESLYVIQKLLGHASPQTSIRYAHFSNEALRKASGQVADAVGRAFPITAPKPDGNSSEEKDDMADSEKDQAA